MESFLVIGSVLILACLILGIYMYIEAHRDRTIHHQLSFPDFPASFDGWTIFFISDIHRRIVADKIIENAQGKANIVFIGGDLAEKGVGLNKIKHNLGKLKKIAPIYFVWGNNDYELDQEAYKSLFTEMGVTALRDRCIKLQTPDGEEIGLIGVDDLSTKGENLAYALQNARDIAFKILVSHDPKIINDIPPEQNIQLVLSGHTHGGQIRFFGWGPYEIGGVKKIGNTTLFVSNGYGTTAIPLRLGAKAETHLITIKRYT
jgi:uncharacterized protein